MHRWCVALGRTLVIDVVWISNVVIPSPLPPISSLGGRQVQITRFPRVSPPPRVVSASRQQYVGEARNEEG